jgi:hypothetical protein
MSYFFDALPWKDGQVPNSVLKDWADKCEPGMLAEIERDYQRLREHLFRGKEPAAPDEKKLYLATGGGPSSAKSTELDFEIESGGAPRYAKAVMVDPDRYIMEYMYTYRQLLSAGMKAKLGIEVATRQAYERAQAGSNIIAILLLNEAIARGFHVIHGTTSTNAAIGEFLKKLGVAGYERKMLLVGIPDDVREAAGHQRIHKEAHFQVHLADFVNKGIWFPQRHSAYFQQVDHLVLLWKSTVNKRATRAAEYKDGKLMVDDADAHQAYIENYGAARTSLAEKNGVTIPSWTEIEHIYARRFLTPSPRSSFRYGLRRLKAVLREKFDNPAANKLRPKRRSAAPKSVRARHVRLG